MCENDKNGKNKKGDDDMTTLTKEKMNVNAFEEMRKILNREMKAQGITAEDVKKGLLNKKNDY